MGGVDVHGVSATKLLSEEITLELTSKWWETSHRKSQEKRSVGRGKERSHPWPLLLEHHLPGQRDRLGQLGQEMGQDSLQEITQPSLLTWFVQTPPTLCPHLQQSHSTPVPSLLLCSPHWPHMFWAYSAFFGLRALACVPSSENALPPHFCLMKTSNRQSIKISVENQTLGMEHWINTDLHLRVYSLLKKKRS